MVRGLFRKAVQQGRSKVRDAKNNERHVCGRARAGERLVSSRRSATILTRSPRAARAARPALPRVPYVEPLSAARMQLADFVNSLPAESIVFS